MVAPDNFMAVVYIIYGLSFLIMGIAVIYQSQDLRRAKLLGVLNYLGIFGLIHGCAEFVELVNFYARNQVTEINMALTGLQTISFLVLLGFGSRAFSELDLAKWVYTIVPVVCVTAWTILVIHSGRYITHYGRYLFLLPGALLGGVSLIRGAQASVINYSGNHREVVGLGYTLIFYGIAAGVITPNADFFPANYFNYAWFSKYFLIPIQLIRAVLAFFMLVFCHLILQRMQAEKLKERDAFLKMAIQTEENVKRISLLDGLNRLAYDMMTARQAEQVGEIVLREAKAVTGAACGRIIVRQGITERFSILSASQVPDSVTFSIEDEVQLLQRVFSGSEDAEMLFKYAYQKGFSQVYCQPLIKEQKLLGGVLLYFGSAKLLSDAQKHYMVSMASMAVLALERAYFYTGLQKQALIDSPLQIYNYRFLREQLNSLKNSGSVHGLLMVDIDNFKEYNSMYGYVKGDEFLDYFIRCIEQLIYPDYDTLCRHSCDRFCIIMSGVTQERTQELIKQILAIVEQKSYYNPRELKLELNFGLQWSTFETEDLLKSVLEELDKAKEDKRRLREERIHQFEKFALVGQLAAGLAHEVRNPLTAVKGFIQLLKGRDSNDDILEIVSDEVNRIESLIKEFLLLAKPSAPEKRSVSVNGLLDEVIRIMEYEANLQSSEIIRAYCGRDCYNITVDKEQIKQVLINIMKNGLEAMEGYGHLFVDYHITNECLRITVEDEGCGIPKEYLGRIFEPFYTQKEDGTGLGLAVSLRIIQSHGGHITVTSSTGQGSVFTIELPLQGN